jgi:catechol 2,3-dioxygenase-like lactoylglutathione lyase family enzyme
MRGVVHHIDLSVREPKTSYPFYDALLRALGYEFEREDDRGFEWKLESGLGTHSVGVVRASADGARQTFDRLSPGLHHVAWGVESREDVDRVHRTMVGIEATVLDHPAEYPQYNRGFGYYAVFFADPDGLKLECVFTPRT